jgi:hypothetical protein
VAQPKVFISYRRSDSQAQTGRLYDRLNLAFPGMFFRDVSEIGVGVDFVSQVERAIDGSVALLAVIGPTWATAADERGRRLDDPDDFVRVEIRTALARKIRIIPVLVGHTEMVDDEQLPDDLKPLTRWNAIRIVEEYYDEAVERLVRSLTPELGEPAHGGSEERGDAKITSLRGEAEAAIGVEDWFGAIQALQAALSLAPGNFEISARLKWANEQRKISGLYAEAQDLYEKGRKAAALAKFRQVRIAGGEYRGVGDLIRQLEREVGSEGRRSSVRRWTFGVVAAAGAVVILIAALVWMNLRNEFTELNDELNAGTMADMVRAAGSPATVPGAEQLADTGRAAAAPAPEPPPARAGVGFTPAGRFRAVTSDNGGMQFSLMLDPGGTFQAQAGNGFYTVPLSGGSFMYDSGTGVLLMSGMNNVGSLFSEPMQILERHDDHFHVVYSGVRWDLIPE